MRQDQVEEIDMELIRLAAIQNVNFKPENDANKIL